MKRALSMIIFFLLFALSACDEGQDPLLSALDEFFAYVDEGDYGSAYNSLTYAARESVELQDFVNKYQDIYSNIDVVSVQAKYEQPKADEESYSVPVEIALDSAVGVISWQIDCGMRREDGTWRLDWKPAIMLQGMDWGDTARLNTDTARRGEILSSDATAWALNSYAPTAYVLLPFTTEREEMEFADRAAPILNMDADAILEITSSERATTDGVALLKRYPIDAMTDALDARIKAAGMGVDYEKYSPLRYYPQKNMLSHLIGYMHSINLDDLVDLFKEGYTENSRIGTDGLEKSFESTLRGDDGKILRIYDETGAIKRTVAGYEARDGLDLELTISHPLQLKAVALLQDLPETVRGGAIVVMNPKNGDVLALASFPDYDPNDYQFPIPNALYSAMRATSSREPLFDRSTQGRYPPGSTIKPFTAVVGLEKGGFTTAYEFPYRVRNREWIPEGSWPFPPIRRVSDYSGDMSMTNAMTHSDNIYFANIALELGWDTFEEYFSAAGFTEAVPFDIPTRASQLYASPSNINRKMLADTGYGQGEMLVTPLQLAAAFSVFANGGSCYAPRVVSALKAMEGNAYVVKEAFEPKVWKEGVVPGNRLQEMREMLSEVMDEGSGQSVEVEGVRLFGKTGTAQLDDTRSREIAWLVAFAEGGENYPDYSRLVCVMLEIPADEGSQRYDIVEALLDPEADEYAVPEP